MRPALLAGALVALAAPVAGLAATVPTWSVDKAASSVRFTSSMGGESFSGVFRRWDADIRFDPANLAGSSVSATIDVASVTTANADRDQALPTATFFDAPTFPKASFVAHGFTAQGPGRYQASGVLPLRGVARPVTLPFTLSITGAAARMSGVTSINRLAFGVGQGEWKAVDAIPAGVSVNVTLVARRAP